MRIELTQDIASSAAKAQQSPLSLGQGEVIRATVVSVEGEIVSLKTEDGRVFSARLQPGTALMENDTVELMAGGSQEQPVLRVVFVEPGQNGVYARKTAEGKAQAVWTRQLAEAFKELGQKPTPRLISLAAEILKNYPADAKTAAFFAANGIPATQESIRAFQTILSGRQFGAAFYEVARDAAAALGGADTQAEAQPNAANPSATQENQTAASQPTQAEANGGFPAQGQQAAQLISQGPAGPEETAEPPPAKVETPAAGQGETAGAQGEPPAQPQNAATAGRQPVPVMPEDAAAAAGKEQINPQAHGAEAGVPEAGKPVSAPQGESGINQAEAKAQPAPRADAAIQQNVQRPQAEGPAIEENTVRPGAGREGAAPQPAAEADRAYVPAFREEHAEQAPGLAPKDAALSPHAQGEEKAVLKRLMDLFAKAGEDLDAQTLKKSVEETPQKLFELQKLIKNTDIHTQEALASRFSELTAQAKLTEDISRFVFVQIPIRFKEYGSAELYIYKRNRREKGAERQSTSVVLGLSTENLGRVEAMLRIEDREISLDIGVQNEGAQNAFREGMGELRQSFSELRFQLKEYRVAPLWEPTTPLNAEEKLRTPAPFGVGAGVDVII
ncbi:MAG TPA: flagellar hook-length control protein FliK [Feifaniaceae bacterium]|nr:flagellar hook-length control protein FliK [Feifaniaceae bacterium]